METCAFNASEIGTLDFFNGYFLNWESFKSDLRALVSMIQNFIRLKMLTENFT